MKKIINPLLAIALGTIFSLSAKAQNLVPNPSFEQYDTCPNNVSQVNRANFWSSFGNTPDYFNSCDTTPGCGVPQNVAGYQFAATGNGYCGVFSYLPTQTYREYIGCQLTDTLQINHKYFVSFKVSLASNPGFNTWSDKIGARFSMVAYSTLSPPALNNFAHVYAHSIIGDTMNWTVVSGSFIADSNYKYMIIGNFFDNAHTDTSHVVGEFSYFYIDDVCVSSNSETCDNGPDGAEEVLNTNQVVIYPNPSKGAFLIQSNLSTNIKDILIYDAFGEAIKFSINKIDVKSYLLDLTQAAKGIYYIKLIDMNQKSLNKIVLIN